MKNIYKKEMIIILSLLAVVVVFIVVQVTTGFISCEKKKDLPWYEDFDNLSFTLSDSSRLTENYYKWKGNDKPDKIIFEYLELNEYFEGSHQERKPRLKIFYKGEEKNVYTYATNKKQAYVSESGEVKWKTCSTINKEGEYELEIVAEKPDGWGGGDGEIYRVGVSVIIKRSENHEN